MPVTIKLGADGRLGAEDAARVAAAAKACKIVAFPAESGYSLGSTALIKAAARKLYQLKQRPTLKPLPVLLPSAAAARRWVEWTPAAELLARAFWPGPLALVLRPTEEGRLLTFPEYQTLAVRVPAAPAALQLLEASGVPWASTSANLAGQPPLTEPAALAGSFASGLDFIVDGGAVPAEEPTFVDATSVPVRVVREGSLSAQAVLEALKTGV